MENMNSFGRSQSLHMAYQPPTPQPPATGNPSNHASQQHASTVHNGALFYHTQSQGDHMQRAASLGIGPSFSAMPQQPGRSQPAHRLHPDHPATSLYAPRPPQSPDPLASTGSVQRTRTGNLVLNTGVGSGLNLTAEQALEEATHILPAGQDRSHHAGWAAAGGEGLGRRYGGSAHGGLQRPSANGQVVLAVHQAPDGVSLDQPSTKVQGPEGVTLLTVDALQQPGHAEGSVRAWLFEYFGKWRGLPGQRPAPRDTWSHMAWGWLGSFISIAIISVLNQHLTPHIDLPLLVASFGASAVLLFGVPDGKLSQPRNFVGGQLFSALTGIVVRVIIPSELLWLSSGLGMATALFVMQATQTTHPPGGATALIASSAVNIGAWHGFKFVLTILFACGVMLSVALVVNNVSSNRRYPMFWF